jgi:hypothetical protein
MGAPALGAASMGLLLMPLCRGPQHDNVFHFTSTWADDNQPAGLLTYFAASSTPYLSIARNQVNGGVCIASIHLTAVWCRMLHVVAQVCETSAMLLWVPFCHQHAAATKITLASCLASGNVTAPALLCVTYRCGSGCCRGQSCAGSRHSCFFLHVHMYERSLLEPAATWSHVGNSTHPLPPIIGSTMGYSSHPKYSVVQ